MTIKKGTNGKRLAASCPNGRLIVALDVDNIDKARHFINILHAFAGLFKIGPILFTAYGPRAVEIVRNKGSEVFLDMKFHDIPNTVAGAIRQATRLKVKMITLHASGGEEMLRRASQAAREEAGLLRIEKPLLLGITVLTSDKSSVNTRATVVARARLAKKCGLDGVVCSVHEASAVRKSCGKKFIIVTPGIRPKGAGAGDQKRIATAKAAFAAGADYIVVGRPVLEASDPAEAIRNIL